MASDGSIVIDILGNSQGFEHAINQSITSIQSKINALNNTLSTLGTGTGLNNLNNNLGSTSTSVNLLNNNVSSLGNSLTGVNSSFALTAQSVNGLGLNAGSANANIDALGMSANNTNSGISLLGQTSANTNTNIQGLGTSVSQAGAGFRTFGNSGVQSINSLAAAFAAAGLTNVTKKLINALGDCINTFASFESQMSTVQSISGASAAEMEKLTEKAKEMGNTTSFTAEQAGEALEYMAMAGWNADQMLDGLDGVMNLAAASGEDLASVSDILTDSLTAFGMSAGQAGEMADVLAAAATSSNTNVGMMGESFKYVAPLAGTLGYNIQDTAVALGLMANSGIKSSMAGTALRSTFNSLSGTSKKANAVFEKLGITLQDDNGNMKSLADVMVQLREKFSNLSKAQQTQYAKTIAGTMGMSGFLAIVRASDEDFNNLTDAINNSAGAAERMANIRLDNLQGSLTLLGSAFDGLKLTIGSQLAPAVETAINAFTWFLNTLNSLAEQFPVFGAVIAGFTAEIAALAAAFSLLAIVKVLTPLMVAFNAVCAANPYVQLALAIVAVGTALYALISYFTDGATAADEAATAMDGAATATENFAQECNTAQGAGRKLVTGVKDSGEAFQKFNEVSKSAVEALKELETEYDEAANAARESLESQFNIWDDLSDEIDEYGSNIKQALESQLEYRRNFNKDVETLNRKHIDGLNEVVQELVKGANEGSKEAVSALHWMAQQNDYTLNQVIDLYRDVGYETERSVGYSATALTDYGNRVDQIFQGVSKSANALDLSDSARQAGINTMKGYIDGLNSERGSVDRAMTDAAKNSWSKFKKGLKMNSPSKLFKQGGVWTMEGYELGIDSKSRDVSNTMQDTARDITKSFNQNAKIELPDIDNGMMQKLNNILSDKSAVIRSNIIDFSSRLAEPTANARNDISSVVNNDNGIVINLTYNGTSEPEDVRKISRQIGAETARELRRRGIPAT